MIRLYLTSLLLLTTGLAWSQKAFIFNTQQKNGFVSLSVGVSQPLGTFSQKTSGPASGMALRGQALSLATGYRLAGPLGLMARYEQTTNTIDPTGLLEPYAATPASQLTAAAAPGRAGQWQTQSLMVGPYLTIPVGRFSVDVRALAGQIWITCPQTSVSGTLNRQETLVRAGGEQATALAAGLGLTTRFRLTPCVAIHLSTDYSSATFSYGNVPAETQYGNYTLKTAQFSQKTLRSATVSVGLTFQFKSRNSVF